MWRHQVAHHYCYYIYLNMAIVPVHKHVHTDGTTDVISFLYVIGSWWVTCDSEWIAE